MFQNRKLVKHEIDASAMLPYARHLTDDIIYTDNDELVAVLKVDGMAFETTDIWRINDWHEKLNIALRSIANDHIAIYSHVIRRKTTEYPSGDFSSDFAKSLDEKYQRHIFDRNMYVNEIYITVILRRTIGRADKMMSGLGRLFSKSDPGNKEDEQDRIERLNDVVQDLGKFAERLAVRRLKTYEHRNLIFSELLEFFSFIMTGRKRHVPLVRGHLGNALYSDRIIFGPEALEIREASSSRLAGIMGVRELAARTFPGMLNGLLGIDAEFVMTQSFAFMSKAAGIETTRRKAGQMSNTDDVAYSQAEELIGAMDDMQSGRFVLGEHHISVMVFGQDVKQLNENIAATRGALSEGGMVAAREDLALEAAYWAQLPGNFKWRTRPAAITSRNFAAMAPYHNYPVGRIRGNHWGDSICLLKTTSRSPFYFSYHVGDLGHTLIVGPSGGGKTVLQNFLLAQTEKTGARQIFIDKDRGAEIYVRACGGTYLSLQNGKPTGFAPLKSLEFTASNKAFLIRWLKMLVTPHGEKLGAADERAIDDALRALEKLPPHKRNLKAVRSMLSQTSEEGIGPRLDRWLSGNELGWVFDNNEDKLKFDARFMGFDMTDFLDNDDIRPVLMAYLFHRIDAVIDGKPVIVDIDEFWKALSDDTFRDFAQDGLKTYRKRNAVMIFGTQSPADALRSDISHSILEQCSTKILLPNPAAREEDYVGGFNLSAAEFALIKTGLTTESRQFLVKQGNNSVVAQLDMMGMDDELAVLSGRASTVALVDELIAEHGEDPKKWLGHFYVQKTGLT